MRLESGTVWGERRDGSGRKPGYLLKEIDDVQDEMQVLAWLADVRSQRAQILADLRKQSLPVPPERLLEPGELVERWKEEKLPHAPTSAEALLLGPKTQSRQNAQVAVVRGPASD